MYSCLGLAFTVKRYHFKYVSIIISDAQLFIQKGMISFLCKIRGNIECNCNLWNEDQPQELQGNTS